MVLIMLFLHLCMPCIRRDLIRDLVEVYFDGIIVKMKSHSSLLDNLAFGVSAGKLLSFLVLHQGIEANSEKIKAIEEKRPPGGIKDVQKIMGCLVALSRFISRLAERVSRSSSCCGSPDPLSGPRKQMRHSRS
jgi:hypothetical protein